MTVSTSLQAIGESLVSKIKEAYPYFNHGFLAELQPKAGGSTYVIALHNGKPLEMLNADGLGSYFYLYFGDDAIVFEDAEYLTHACMDSYQMSVPAKLIFWALKANVHNLFYLMNRFLIANARELGSLVELKINSVNMNPRRIFEDELGVPLRKLPTGLALLSYDLTFLIQTEHVPDHCLEDIKICTDC
jgi:hypothetical protein